MNDLFVETLKDVYSAEKQILKALPGMAKKARAGELKEAFESHKKETEQQIERLEKVFEMLDITPRGKKCEAIDGIIREAKEGMQEIDKDDVLDAGIIGSAHTIEHYEICRYVSLVQWAKDLGLEDAAKLMEQTLEQERNADNRLTRIDEKTLRHAAA
ncbi:MAG: hypothetical protein C3F11_09280 [Methylocystaceae bacterium]|nr:MAG: hypothetical protein C3F11_09280 [Methylocystaceae bacterium]